MTNDNASHHSLEFSADEQNAEVAKAAQLVDFALVTAPDFGQAVKTMVLRAQAVLLALAPHTGPEFVSNFLKNATIPTLDNYAASEAAEADTQADVA
jgi:hypothetical protein